MSKREISLNQAAEITMDVAESDTQPIADVVGQPELPETLEVRPYPDAEEAKTIQWAYAFNSDHTIFNSLTGIFLIPAKDKPGRHQLIIETLPTYATKDKRWISCGEVGQMDPNEYNKNTTKRLARA